jgi:hypothetical protein
MSYRLHSYLGDDKQLVGLSKKLVGLSKYLDAPGKHGMSMARL